MRITLTAAKNMVHTERQIEPDQARHEEYSFWLERYLEMYPGVKDVMHTTARHLAESGSPSAAAEVPA